MAILDRDPIQEEISNLATENLEKISEILMVKAQNMELKRLLGLDPYRPARGDDLLKRFLWNRRRSEDQFLEFLNNPVTYFGTFSRSGNISDADIRNHLSIHKEFFKREILTDYLEKAHLIYSPPPT